MPSPCILSVADHAGWAHIVCVSHEAHVPVVVERRKVQTIDACLPTMPYHHETLRMGEREGDALIARVRQSVDSCTSRALTDTVAALMPSHAVTTLAIREPTFPDLPDTVATVHQSYQLQCAADGLMYQLAWCRAAREHGLRVQQCRRGEEFARAAMRLGVSTHDVEAFVSGKGRPTGPPWTEEHRRAFAAGIAALAEFVERALTIPPG